MEMMKDDNLESYIKHPTIKLREILYAQYFHNKFQARLLFTGTSE